MHYLYVRILSKCNNLYLYFYVCFWIVYTIINLFILNLVFLIQQFLHANLAYKIALVALILHIACNAQEVIHLTQKLIHAINGLTLQMEQLVLRDSTMMHRQCNA